MQNCRYILVTGDRCRGIALSHRPYCRHHSENPRNHQPKAKPLTRRQLWRGLATEIPQLEVEEVFATIQRLMDALCGNEISHRCAGKLLQALSHRLREITP